MPLKGTQALRARLEKGSLRKKILRVMIVLVVSLLIVTEAIFFLARDNVADILVESDKNLTQTIGEQSSATLARQSQDRLTDLARGKAEVADGIFSDFKRSVGIVASAARQIYSNPDHYSGMDVPLPRKENAGKLSVQVLYSAGTDPADPRIVEERRLIGNVQDTLMAVNANQDSLASIYVATESGFMVQADYIADKKYDEAGKLMPLEAKDRPWYQGAVRTGRVFLTPVTRDVHTPRLAIMCGIPIYSGGKLMGVAGGGMYLDDMDSLISSVDLGGSGNACIINRSGQVLFSTYSEGLLSATEGSTEDLRACDNAELADMASKAVSGGSGVSQVTIDGVPCYAAYAPMRTVGWSMIVFQTREAVDAPTKELLAEMDRITDRTFTDARHHVRRATWLMVGLVAVAMLIVILLSLALSQRIAKPIRLLTEEVSRMEGDRLDFRWDLDTGDETQMLAESFQSLTRRMKDYISDIETITSERERISTELSLATRIQENMLPNIFPAFPDRPEFDIYASMDPAKEVGGDFFDFFLIDDDHLCMVMADVSGKGVPAALFMMASKIILANHAMMGLSPARILTETNAAICSNNREGMFVTAWLGILEISTGKITAANAGHEYPALMRAGGAFELLKDRHGFVIGTFDGVRYKDYEIVMNPGDKLFLYTDGLPEATNAEGEMFGQDGMLGALNAETGDDPEKLLKAVNDAANRFSEGSEQFDDLTMLCLEYKGKNGAGEPKG